MSTLTKSEALQLGKAEFGRILDGKVPNVGAVLSLGAFLFVRLKMRGDMAGASIEQVSGIVEEILRESLEVAEARGIAVGELKELRRLAGEYKAHIEPALLASLGGVEEFVKPIAAAGTSRWRKILAAFRCCLSVAAVAAAAAVVASDAGGVSTAAADPPGPSAAELLDDRRLVIDPKAPPAREPPHAPTPPPTPEEPQPRQVL